jgi:hypothetical protein
VVELLEGEPLLVGVLRPLGFAEVFPLGDAPAKVVRRFGGCR